MNNKLIISFEFHNLLYQEIDFLKSAVQNIIYVLGLEVNDFLRRITVI